MDYSNVPVSPAKQRAIAARPAAPIRSDACNNPQPIVVVPASRHPVYGCTPIGKNGFTLQRQSLSMLDYWHRTAARLVADNALADSDRQKLQDIRGEIFEVAVAARPDVSADVALQLAIIVREGRIYGGVNVIGLAELEQITDGLVDVTGPIKQKKTPGIRSRGGKLTRAGLLGRYQSFLVQELETLSFNMYGDPAFAFQHRIEDDAVNLRCTKRSRRGKSYPLFDENKLADRAKSVLKSLKIDTERADTSGHRRTARR